MMTKEQFIRKLRDSLSGVPQGQLDEIIADYLEYFRDGVASGRSETEIAASLGDPAKIAKELLYGMHIQAWQTRKSFGNLGRVVLALVALGSLNLFLAIPMLLVMCVLTASYGVSVLLLLIGLVAVACYLPGGDPVERVLRGIGIPLHLFVTGSDASSDTPQASIPKDGKSIVIDRDAAGGQHMVIKKDGKTVVIDQDVAGGQHMVITKDGKTIELDQGSKQSADNKDGRKETDVQVEDAQGKGTVHLDDGDDDDDTADKDDDELSSEDIDFDINGWSPAVSRAVVAAGGLGGGGLLLLFNVWLTRLIFRGFIRYAKLHGAILKNAR